MEQNMYGSIHTHFEDWFDTANDKKKMILEFANQGAKRVVLTGHGNMFALEDLKEIVKSLKDDGAIDPDFEVVPGVEIYFSDEARHMILIAKNYEGYLELCRVINESATNSKVSKGSASEDNEYLTPIVTLENLQRNITKGNVFATSACINGVFGQDLGLRESKLERAYNSAKESKRKRLSKVSFSEEELKKAQETVDYWSEQTSLNKKPTAAELKKITKAIEKIDENTPEEKQIELMAALDDYNRREQLYDTFVQAKLNAKIEIELAKKLLKKYKEHQEKLVTESEPEMKARLALEEYRENYPQVWEDTKKLYYEFENIFGKENFFFELQNHGLEVEKTVYNNIIKFALEVGNRRFIASNDTHIGDRKGSETWEASVNRREIERAARFKFSKYKSREIDTEEYGIKNDAELKEALEGIITGEYRTAEGTLSAESIINASISNIEKVSSQCNVKFPEISINGVNHYPKFCDDEVSRFREEVEKGLKERFPNGLPEGYRERANYEMDIICNMGYAGYHLIVQDYLRYGNLLGYLRSEEEIADAPLTSEELEEYIKVNNIPKVGMGIGPGRGSAAGSLCCYALHITDMDPIKHGLLFERFLNPERVSMPDIDSDFRNDTRDKMYEYIKAKYGDDCVSRVVTKAYAYGKKSTKIAQQFLLSKKNAEIDDKNLDKAEADTEKDAIKRMMLDAQARVSKMIDREFKNNANLSSNHPEDGTKALRNVYNRGEMDALEKEIAETALSIEGIPSVLSQHACAAIISGDPLHNCIPLAWNEAKQSLTTQCLYPQAENLGLLKMDMLAIKNLWVITKVNQETGDARLQDLEERERILADKDIYHKIYGTGKTLGIFQFESDGMRDMIKKFHPENFDDIVILVAAYRPGPMDFIPGIIARKWYNTLPFDEYAKKIQEIYPFNLEAYHNAKEKGNVYFYDEKGNVLNPLPMNVAINNDKLQEILAPTYGVPIYQEQVMQIFQAAGYSLAGADNVRRFMSKKKTDKLEKERPVFIKGCIDNLGIAEEEATMLFDKLVEFSKYAFNKSHAACYAQVAVFTAYQKLYHTREFFKYSLSNEIRDGGKGKDKDENPVAKYLDDITAFGYELLPPAIGKSDSDVKSEGTNGIRLGYGNIKGESYNSVYRSANDIQSFIEKNPTVSLKTVSKFVSLGMFDACWHTADIDSERIRVNKNRTLMANWVDQYGEKFKDLFSLSRDIKALTAEIEDLQTVAKNCTPEEAQILSDAVSEKTETLSSMKQKFSEQYEYLKSCKEQDMEYPDETPDQIREGREAESKLIGFPFSVKDVIDRLKVAGVTNFETMQTAGKFNIPASVVSVKEKVSKKGALYYTIKAMDQTGSIIELRSFDKPTKTEGIFTIDYSLGKNGFKDSYLLKDISNFPDGDRLVEKSKEPVNFTSVGGRIIPTVMKTPAVDGNLALSASAEETEEDEIDR